MAKLKHLCATISFLTLCCLCGAQAFTVNYVNVDGDSANLDKASLQKQFTTKSEAAAYIFKLSSLLQTRGFISASIDSIYYDSATAHVRIYMGDRYKWARIHASPETEDILEAVHWPSKSFSGNMDFITFQTWQKRILDYLEDNGHPFGKTYLENIIIEANEVEATLKIDKGPIYKIDSIRIFGDAKVNNEFLQRYLEIPDGSLYNRKKLQNISKRLRELSFVQEEKASDLTLLATGSVLNLYLKARKTSQINALVGFAPGTDPVTGNQKLLLTADANVLLKNAFGGGETIALVWQQLQQKSPRLNLLFERPYINKSPFGINFSIDMYKQDSTYLNIDMLLGTNYRIEERQTTTIFLQRRQTIVNGVDTNAVKLNHSLPKESDVSSLNLGIGYSFINTDYRLNPHKGNELNIISTAGTKTLKKNNQIIGLKDPTFNYESLYDTVKLKAYQFRVIVSASHYIPLAGQSTLKLGLNAGLYQSASYYTNELFRIGGYRLLRGFDEQSQYVSQYGIGTVEYRYRLGLNSYFFGFADLGWGKHLLELINHHTYFGTGMGLSFETKAGIIHLAWAVGKRDDTQLNLRQSKIHIGFASYF